MYSNGIINANVKQNPDEKTNDDEVDAALSEQELIGATETGLMILENKSFKVIVNEAGFREFTQNNPDPTSWSSNAFFSSVTMSTLEFLFYLGIDKELLKNLSTRFGDKRIMINKFMEELKVYRSERIGHMINAKLTMIGSLKKPIKIFSKEQIRVNGFKIYEDSKDFIRLNQENYKQVLAISHKWKGPDQVDPDDVKHILDLKLPEDILYFYDYSSLPQIKAKDINDITSFKAGLSILNLLFSNNGYAIVTDDYYFRWWCFFELVVIMGDPDNRTSEEVKKQFGFLGSIGLLDYLERAVSDLRRLAESGTTINVLYTNYARIAGMMSSLMVSDSIKSVISMGLLQLGTILSTLTGLNIDSTPDDWLNPNNFHVLNESHTKMIINVFSEQITNYKMEKESLNNYILNHLQSCTISNDSDKSIILDLYKKLFEI
jgi:hypothetical protein